MPRSCHNKFELVFEWLDFFCILCKSRRTCGAFFMGQPLQIHSYRFQARLTVDACLCFVTGKLFLRNTFLQSQGCLLASNRLSQTKRQRPKKKQHISQQVASYPTRH